MVAEHLYPSCSPVVAHILPEPASANAACLRSPVCAPRPPRRVVQQRFSRHMWSGSRYQLAGWYRTETPDRHPWGTVAMRSHVGEDLETMPIGPNGERRPHAVIANAVLIMRIATGQADETNAKVLVHESAARPPVQRSVSRISRITRLAAVARWGPRPADDIDPGGTGYPDACRPGAARPNGRAGSFRRSP